MFQITLKDSKTYVAEGINNYMSYLKSRNEDVCKALVQLWNNYCESVGHHEDCMFDMNNVEDRKALAEQDYNLIKSVYEQGFLYYILERDNMGNVVGAKPLFTTDIIRQIIGFSDELMTFMLNYPNDFNHDARYYILNELFCDIGYAI